MKNVSTSTSKKRSTEPAATQAPGAPRSRSREPASVEDISERVLGAIWENRLPPGTKLVEEKLATVFGVSRTKVRLALAKLAHDGILTVEPNRGTFVSSPTVEQARQVLATRRVIEPCLLRDLGARLRPEHLEGLRKNIEMEDEARSRNDRRAIIRLAGEFHIRIAEMSDNPYLTKYMRELCSLTCLVIALYDAPGEPSCPEHEHRPILEALGAGKIDKACALMVDHLAHVENALRLEMPSEAEVDFEAIFA